MRRVERGHELYSNQAIRFRYEFINARRYNTESSTPCWQNPMMCVLGSRLDEVYQIRSNSQTCLC